MRKIFRRLVTVEEAAAVIRERLPLDNLKTELTPIIEALGRVLAEDVVSPLDVPGFDRSAMDGYAVRAEDTYRADEAKPVNLRLKGRVEAGHSTDLEVSVGEAVEVSTGAPIPRGANAVVMVEHTVEAHGVIQVFHSVSPGENITSTGSDISIGEVALRRGSVINYREIGVLAALGRSQVRVYARPRVAILSTGDELVSPGLTLNNFQLYDVNSYSLFAAVQEAGCSPILMGVVRDDELEFKSSLMKALNSADVVVTSGSTSAGFGDMMYRVLEELEPGSILIHGLSVKPGKPTLVARVMGKPVFGLPGYPASAMTIFNVLVKPYLASLSRLKPLEGGVVEARFAVKLVKAGGRRELMPVHVIGEEGGGLVAYPILKGSGAVTSFSLADGFIDIPAHLNFLEEGEVVNVNLYSPRLRPASLVLIGSHCPAVDHAVSILINRDPNCRVKAINVGSTAGLNAAVRGEADLAGIHLLHRSGVYNEPYVRDKPLMLVRGYNRLQGFVFRKNVTFNGFEDLLSGRLTFINRNKGSGTRALIDILLEGYCREVNLSYRQAAEKIKGFNVECKTHSSVASAVKAGKADVGVAVKAYAEWYDLNFKPISVEEYDFAVRRDKVSKLEVKAFIETLKSDEFKVEVESKIPGVTVPEDAGEPKPLKKDETKKMEDNGL